MQRQLPLLPPLLPLLLLLGCDSEQQPPLEMLPPSQVCIAGEPRSCECLDGRQGMQVCEEGIVFSACACGGALDAGVLPDARPAPDATPPPPLVDAEVVEADAEVVAVDAEVVEVDAEVVEVDAAPPPPQACPAPESVRAGGVEIFRYEASHPLATDRLAFPGAVSQGQGVMAPPGDWAACSRPGVRPWHTVTWEAAQRACEGAGWRLCSPLELRRACAGPANERWTWGSEFEAGACNLREGYRAPGAEFASEAPTGAFDRCVSAEGAYDLTGNLWEWTDDGALYQGAGWRTIAERHRDADMVCTAETRVRAGEGYANADLGFRCCR